MSPLSDRPESVRLRLLSFNIQAGTTTARYRHYVTHSWRQVLPHSARIENLDGMTDFTTRTRKARLRPLDATGPGLDPGAFARIRIAFAGEAALPHHRRRAVGRSRWSFGKKVSYLMDGVMSYSFLPIRWLSMLGGGVALSGFVYAAVILVDRLVNGNPVTGWAPLMIVLLIVSGLQLLMLGMIGEYLWRTLAQARNREAYLVDRIYE